MFNNKTILITGGTGSFGKAFADHLLKNFDCKKIIIYSRDEMKQFELMNYFNNNSKLRCFIGDVKDKSRLHRALDGVNYVVHAAALKIVPIAEYNPFETVKTNIVGSTNLIDASIDQGVEKVILLSTDKACDPVNLYGATKMAAEKIFSSSNVYSTNKKTIFSIVRYGNVMGSRGSVIPFFFNLKKNRKSKFPLTHPDMTRFMMDMSDCIEIVKIAFKDSVGGEIYVKKAPSIKIKDIIKVIDPKAKILNIGVRPGEKLHEKLIGEYEGKFTYEYKGHFKIISAIYSNNNLNRLKNLKKVEKNFSYTSDNNKEWMSINTLKNWIKKNLK